MRALVGVRGSPLIHVLLLGACLVLAVACSGGGSGGSSDPVCGNGQLEEGEACDDGLAGLGACTATCQWQEFSVEPTPFGSNAEPRVAVSENGRFVVVYQKREGISDFDVYGVVYDRNGEVLWGPTILNLPDDVDQWLPRVDAGPNGSFVAVWEGGPEGDRDVYVKWFMAEADWQAVEPEQRVNQHSMGDQYYPSVNWLPDGGAVVVWSGDYVDGDSTGVLARMYGPNRTPLADEFVVNTWWQEQQKYPTVDSAADGRFVVTWESKCQEAT